jgi:hypothetical protein
VYIRRGGVIPGLAPLYTGPYKVQARQAKFLKLEIGGHQETVTVDRLKPYLGLAPVVSAVPPCSPWTAAGPKSRLSAQLGTVFPGLPERFFARPSWSTLASKSGGGRALSRPIYLLINPRVVFNFKLKGPKHEIFESGFFTHIRRLWLGALGTGAKKMNFRKLESLF